MVSSVHHNKSALLCDLASPSYHDARKWPIGAVPLNRIGTAAIEEVLDGS
jgi:hypothetical protein